MARAVLTPMPERLKASRTEVDDALDALGLARKRRDQLVREACDEEGMSQRVVAGLAGVSGPRVAAILATPDDDDETEPAP